MQLFEIKDTDNNVKEEINSRVTAKLGIKTECKWRRVDVGMYGCNDYVYQTSCNTEFDADKTHKSKFCPNCGNAVVGSPSFEEWLNKYFEIPKMKMMYKRKDGKGEYDREKLLKDYKRAYRLS